jgi:hypothetical protein
LPPLEMSAQPGQAAQDPGMAAAAIEFQQALMRLLHDVMKISDDDEAFSVPDTAADQRLDIASDDTPAGQPSPHLAAAPASAAVSGKTRKPGKPERALKAELLKRLSTWLHQLCKKGSKFEKLPVATQHDVRKAVKNLRYCLDFAEGILPRSGTARLRVRMARIQEELGELNDYYVAQSCYQDLLPGQPQAWFALGWLAAMQAQKRARAQQLFRKLSEQSTL